MDILSYLLELLQQSKQVGITGLGTFYKKKFPGRYDKEKQSFLPPGYTLQFSSAVKEEDALVNFISSKRNISVEDSRQSIAQFVDEINKKLEVEHEAVLENTGRLFFTEHEGLSFEPSKNIHYGSEFYGLPTVAEPEIISKEVKSDLSDTEQGEEVYEEIAEAPTANRQAEKVEEAEQIHPVIENVELDEVHDDLKNTLKHTENEVDVPEPIKKQHQEHPNRFGHKPESEEAHKSPDQIHKEEPVIQAPEFIKEQHAEHPNRFGHDPLTDEPITEESKSIWPKIWIGALILLAIALAVYFLKPELFNSTAKVETKPTVLIDSPKVEIDSAKIKQDSISKTDSILKANQVVKTDSIKGKPVVSPAYNTGTPSFEIIAASYATIKGATRYIRAVKKAGINARIVDMPGKRQNISIGSFKTQKEAEDQLIILQKKLNGKGFYIQKINTP